MKVVFSSIRGVFISGAIFAFALLPLAAYAEEVACTYDLNICPDGSMVSRNPNDNCNFEPCPEDGDGDDTTGESATISPITNYIEGEEDDMMACAADVQECSDGSYVSRNPADDCNFDACPDEMEVKEPTIDETLDKDDNNEIGCDADAKICPDGSAVGRNGTNNCEYDPCPSIDPATSCEICQDGRPVGDPTKEVYGKSCDDWQVMALYNRDPNVCVEFEYLGSLCGCGNTPPEDGCHMCPGDGALGRPERLLPDFDFFGTQNSITCEESRKMVQYTYPSGPGFCSVQNSVMADYCGCTVASEKKCDICGTDKMINGRKAPAFTLIDGDGKSTNITDYSCLDAEYVANLYGQVDICNNIRDQVAEDCCEDCCEMGINPCFDVCPDGSLVGRNISDNCNSFDPCSAAITSYVHSFGSIAVGAACFLLI